MAMIDIKHDPSRKDLRIFSLLWLVFFVLLGFLSYWQRTEHSLLNMAIFCAGAFLISIAFNTEQPRKLQLIGLLIPAVLTGIWALEHKLGVAPIHVVYAVAGVGVAGGLLIFASPATGKSIYVTWMYAALPIGWTVSHAILAVVFYGVLTPIGLIMRATGRDSMNRKFDAAATTYWLPHKQQTDASRYFRQF